MNYKNKIQEFIKGEIWKISNSKSSITDYWGGYKQALIDIECFVIGIESEQELIGKWGYFYDDNVTYGCLYAKLLNIEDIGDGKKIYISETSLAEHDKFSLTIPKHLK